MHPDDEQATAATGEKEVDPDPGELVSIWYAMKKQYEETLAALRAAAGQLNAIGLELHDQHGIIVPRVADGPGQPSAARSPAADAAVEASPGDPAWSPPSQGPISIDAPTTSVRFVEELRSNAQSGEGEKDFAAHIGKMFRGFENFGR
jgi:hypothetical protein